jgi:hypothetical protein
MQTNNCVRRFNLTGRCIHTNILQWLTPMKSLTAIEDFDSITLQDGCHESDKGLYDRFQFSIDVIILTFTRGGTYSSVVSVGRLLRMPFL